MTRKIINELASPADVADAFLRMSYADMHDFASEIVRWASDYANERAENDTHLATLQVCLKELTAEYVALLLLDWAAETLMTE
jgi:ribulose bisphosphate carboxylase small subunit